MEANRRKRIPIILAALVAAAVIVSAFVHAGEDDFITDPVRLAASWEVTEVWQGEKLVSDNQTSILIAVGLIPRRLRRNAHMV